MDQNTDRTPVDILAHIAVRYPGNMAEGIDAWLDAVRAAGFSPEVVWRENGTGEDGLAVVDFPGIRDWSDNYTTRVWTRVHYRYSISHDRRAGTSHVHETRPSDGTRPWRYFPAWEGPTSELPSQFGQENVPYLVVAEWAGDDHELHVLRTPDGKRRAGVVFGEGSEFAAWTLGALDLPEYELDYYKLHGDLQKAAGTPETAAELADGVRRCEEQDRRFWAGLPAAEERRAAIEAKVDAEIAAEMADPKTDAKPLEDWEKALLNGE